MRGLNALSFGLRAVDPLQSANLTDFAAQCAAVGAVLDTTGTPHCVLQSYAHNVGPDLTKPAIPGARAVSDYRSNPAAGGCPIIDPVQWICAYGSGDGTISCNAIDECDWATGQHHILAPFVGGGGATPNPGPIAGSASGTQTGSGAGASSSENVLGVSIENLSGGSASNFRIGDKWRITVSGPANAAVTNSAQQNGVSLGQQGHGTTDASGKLILTGTMDASTQGGWTEQWYVGGNAAGNLSFTVAPTSAVTNVNQQGANPTIASQQAGTTSNAQNGGQVSDPASDNTLLYLGIAAATAFFLFSGRH